MEIKIKHRDIPAVSPGSWEDSTLRVFIKGKKEDIKFILENLKKSIGELSENK